MTYSCIPNAQATAEQQGQCAPGHMMQQGQAFVLVSADLPPLDALSGAAALGFALGFGLPRMVSTVIREVKRFVIDF